MDIPLPRIAKVLLLVWVFVVAGARSHAGSGGVPVVWGENDCGRSSPPPDLTNAISIAFNYGGIGALTRDGRVRVWGSCSSAITNVPASVTNVVMVSADGGYGFAGVRKDGSIVSWNGSALGIFTNAVATCRNNYYSPSGLIVLTGDGYVWYGNYYNSSLVTNAIAIWPEPGTGVIGLLRNGRLASTFSSYLPPANLYATNLVSFALGSSFSVALRSDKTVVTWGAFTNVPAGLSNVVVIAAGSQHALALRDDGTVIAWGQNTYGQTNVPAGLTNVVSISASGNNNLALRDDGTVVAWGDNSYGQTNVPAGLTNVSAIYAAGTFSVVLRGSYGPAITAQPLDQAAWATDATTFLVSAVGSPRLRYQWQRDGEFIPGATNAWLRIENTQFSDAGIYSVVVSNDRGTSVSREARLNVREGRLTFISNLTNVSVWFGNSAQLTVSLNGYAPMTYQWYFNGNLIPSATTSLLVPYPSSENQSGNYWVVVSNAFGMVTSAVAQVSIKVSRGNITSWGNSSCNLSAIPPGISNIAAISAGWFQSLALLSNGTVVGWGCDTNVPASATNVVAISAGVHHCLALRRDGTVVSWGPAPVSTPPYDVNYVPPEVTNVVAIEAGYSGGSMALREEGTVAVWGGYVSNAPFNLNGVVAIALGARHCLALLTNGAVAKWGDNSSGQLNFDYYYGAMGIAASKEDNQSLILKNGYVSAFGAVAIMPTPLLSNVIAVACGNSYQNMALHGDGRVTHWSLNTVQTLPPGITNIAAISMAGTHKMVLPHGAYAGPTMSAISASKDGDWFSVQVPTARGKNYYLQYRDTTRNSQWQMAMLFPGPLPGNDKLRTFTDYSGGSTERYYRVWQKP